MDSSQDLSENDTDVMPDESGGTAEDGQQEVAQSDGQDGAEVYPEGAAKRPSGWQRLKRKNQEHEREIRGLHARIAQMQSAQPAQQMGYDTQPQGNLGGDETIQKAVSYALQQRDLQERKAKDAQQQEVLANEYQQLQQHLDKTSDKYDDFDDVVRSNTAPFTPTIRDTSLLLPKDGPGSAGEVLYKLGKNPEELHRISQLYPHQQAAEVIKLSQALMSGGAKNNAQSPRPLGTVKANPVVNSVGVNEKTPPSQIRALMKAGKFK